MSPFRVAPLIAGDHVVDCLGRLARVDKLVGVDSRERVAHHIAHIVEARLVAADAGLDELRDGIGRVLERDAPELHVLARGHVEHAKFVAVGLDEVGAEARLLRREDAVVHLAPDHEGLRRVLGAVEEARPLETEIDVVEIKVLPRGLACAQLGRELVHLRPRCGAVLCVLHLLELVCTLGALEHVLGHKVRAGLQELGPTSHLLDLLVIHGVELPVLHVHARRGHGRRGRAGEKRPRGGAGAEAVARSARAERGAQESR
mmetsp:Transcript_18000/g.44336  ORF Transcript_18000/g.44336 Transcript_18000/m.44336 type:complete len:260 (-) Transcript_18000:21-800(-)